MGYKRAFRIKMDFTNETILSKFEHLTEIKIFDKILTRANPDTLEWTHTKEERETICAKITIPDSNRKSGYRTLSEISFKKHISKMVKNDILVKKSKGIYKINKTLIER